MSQINTGNVGNAWSKIYVLRNFLKDKYVGADWTVRLMILNCTVIGLFTQCVYRIILQSKSVKQKDKLYMKLLIIIILINKNKFILHI